MSRWCVRVRVPDGDDLVVEMFDDRRLADAFYRSLQEDSPDNPVNVLHYPVLIVTMEEEHPSWVPVSRKLVMR